MIVLALWCAAHAATLTYADVAPTTANPLVAATAQDRRLTTLIFDRIVETPAVDGVVHSRVLEEDGPASAVAVTAIDATHVRLRVRTDVRWHDGVAMTPADVCFTLDALRDPRTASPFRAAVTGAVAGCAVEGDAVVLALTGPDAPLLRALAVPLLPRHAFSGTAILADGRFDRHPVGTGPMRLVAWHHREIDLVAYPNPTHAPPVDRVRVVPCRDGFAAVEALLRGRVDGTFDVPAPLWPEVGAGFAWRGGVTTVGPGFEGFEAWQVGPRAPDPSAAPEP